MTPNAPTSTAAGLEAVPMLDLKRQYASIKDEVQAALERVLATQHFIGGAGAGGFERESAEYLGVRASVGCASGTDALWLALAGMRSRPGDQRRHLAVQFLASVSSIVRCGATPVLADIDPATLNLDPAAAENALKRARSAQGPSAVMPVHLYGQCADMDEFAASPRTQGSRSSKTRRRLSARSGATRKPGRLGTVGGFSFYPTKNLSAYGDGGCVTTDDEELADACSAAAQSRQPAALLPRRDRLEQPPRRTAGGGVARQAEAS